MHKKETADAMFLHLNTIKYRLSRVEEVPGMNPTNPFDIAELRFYLMLDTLNLADP
jgi:DNA-binding PucR family transcriptional regulator